MVETEWSFIKDSVLKLTDEDIANLLHFYASQQGW